MDQRGDPEQKLLLREAVVCAQCVVRRRFAVVDGWGSIADPGENDQA